MKKNQRIQNIYKLTPMQSGMLFHSLLDEGSQAYAEQAVLTIRGQIDPELLQKSFQALIQRYDILRTVFQHENVKQPLQIVLKERKFELHYEDIAHLAPEDRQNRLAVYKKEDLAQGFDLARDMLMRFALLQTGSDTAELIWSFHHIIMDGWCLEILFKDLMLIYRGFKTGQPAMLPPVTSYGNYMKWLERRDQKAGLAYWKRYLQGYDKQASLPRMQQSKSGYQQAEYQFVLTEEQTRGVQQIATTQEVTLNKVIQTMWGILLQRYNRTDDVVFGEVVSGRPSDLPGMENMIGLFINTVPVRIQSQPDQSFVHLLKEVQRQAGESKAHEYLALSEVQNQSALKGNLIDQIMVFENYLRQEDLQELGDDPVLGFQVEQVQVHEETNYDFNFVVVPDRRLRIHFNYNAQIYSSELVQRISEHFLQLVSQVVQNPQVQLTEIELLTAKERELILGQFNQTQLEVPKGQPIQRLIEQQVVANPKGIALISGETSITYGELNGKANQLARLLREKGVQAETIVGLLAERSIELVIGILAVLKAGGAYLPISPVYPPKRIKYMLQDSGASLLLTQSSYLETYQGVCPVVDLEDARIYQGDQENLLVSNSDENLAYVIYTSGSTGQPKGVMVEHQALINFVYAMYQNYSGDFTAKDRCLSITNISFDVSVCEFFLPLVAGAEIVLMQDEKVFEVEELAQTICAEEITFAYLPPGLLLGVAEELETFGEDLALNKMLVGVEPISDHVLERYLKLNPQLQIVNGYGPTEATICATGYQYRSHEPTGQIVPIGSPLANNQILLLDQYDHLVPLGVEGEVCIGGAGLARGYLNRPELTEEKFMQLPGHEGMRLYRTGDLARWDSEGNLTFAGRLDQQVKIRGYRIELGEIENALLQLEEVNEVVVIDREDEQKQKYLAAYLVTEQELDVASIRNRLVEFLPGYMLPAYYLRIEEIPLTANGKLDRKALPVPEVVQEKHREARNNREKLLIQIWQEVLGVKKIGIDDNFFELGGDSIKAIQVSTRLKKHQLQATIGDLFTSPTIAQFSDLIQTLEDQKIDQGMVRGQVPLTPIQSWFFENQFTEADHFNHAVVLQRKDGFSEEFIQQVFSKILEHHDALRMRYEFTDGEITQWNRGPEESHFDLTTLSVQSDEELTRGVQTLGGELQQGLDLAQGPLVKLGLVQSPAGDTLIIVIHHLVVDGVSWRILLEDLAVGYQQALQGEEIQFQEKTDSFKSWAQGLREYAQTPQMLRELDYWQRMVALPVAELPKDHQIAPELMRNENVKTLTATLTAEETEQLSKKANWAYSTEMNDLLLAAVARAFKEWAGLERLRISLEGHGRENLLEQVDISRTVGWFTSLFPVVFELNQISDLAYCIKSVKETLRRVPNKGMGYGLLRYLTAQDVKSGQSLQVEPEISYNYLGTFGGEKQSKSLFTLANLQAGNTMSLKQERTNTFDLNLMIVEGQLNIAVTYNHYEYSQERVQKLVDQITGHLAQIIAHCTGQKEKEVTPTDVGNKKISLKDFDKVKSLVRKKIR